ncbi:MAG: fluoride efflux transporter CrcB [bacterium]
MLKYILTFIGAGLGGSLRLFISANINKIFPVYFPNGTLVVNTLGSFLLGAIIFGLDENKVLSSELKIFLTIGFCGGFTTFSTFSLETINLLKNAEFLLGGLNIILSLILCLGSVYLAYIIFR